MAITPSNSAQSLSDHSRAFSRDQNSHQPNLHEPSALEPRHTRSEAIDLSEIQTNLTPAQQPQQVINSSPQEINSMRAPNTQTTPIAQLYRLSPTAADAVYIHEQARHITPRAEPESAPPNQELLATNTATNTATISNPFAPAQTRHINHWNTNRLQLISRQNSLGLNHGILNNSTIVKNYLRQNPDPNWRNFCNKFQAFIETTRNNENMVARLEVLILKLNDKQQLQQQIHRIAEDSAANCQDGAFGSLIEMEKTILKNECIEKIKTSVNPELTFSQVLELAHGLYLVQTLENLAETIGKVEAVEAFLYFMKEYAPQLHLPIEAGNFLHEHYAQGLYIPKPDEQNQEPSILLCSEEGSQYIRNTLIAAYQDTDEFAKSLAAFNPYHEYLTFHENQNETQSPLKVQTNFIQNTAQDISLDITEASEVHLLTTLENNIEKLKEIPDIRLVISNDEFAELQSDIQQLQNKPPTTFSELQKSDSAQESSEDQTRAYLQQMQQLESGLLFQFDQDESDTPPFIWNTTFTPQTHNENTSFELNFLRDKMNNLAMRTYNNAHKISYFKNAIEHATLFIATLNLPTFLGDVSNHSPSTTNTSRSSSPLLTFTNDIHQIDYSNVSQINELD